MKHDNDNNCEKNNRFFQKVYSIEDARIEAVFEIIFNKVPIYVFSQKYLDKKIFDFNYKGFDLLFYSKNYLNKLKEENFDLEDFTSEDRNDVSFYINRQKEIIVKFFIMNGKVFAEICGVDKEHLNELLAYFSKFPYLNIHNNKISLLIRENSYLRLKEFAISIPNIDIELNYGNKFIKKDKTIIEKLNDNKSGLFLLYGDIGTGKTTYIKYLTKEVSRPFIFVPSGLISSLTAPDLITLLINSKNSILILEDAEKAVTSRQASDDPSLVSTILNLSDGILGSILNTALIVTFNTKKESIDPALLRKGRLIVEHEFNKLSIENTQKLLTKLNKSVNIEEAMSLAEIYNLEEENFHQEENKNRIGF